ncbi:hypothetical protein [Tumebacillus flagellatus]|uniref:Uncharacterized protein n=1 Tax=Tumebacillus flagellatus TaxID=1157490 RepID=A0A074LNQ0_9BACL|nr:hypothetical protein [Tumebacillus flagellatus]KEO82095.1 hypothetical protein EL26_17450 [Tumebacillus flagellatus]
MKRPRQLLTHQQNLLRRLSNLFTKDENSLLGQLLGAIGGELDRVDPAKTELDRQFTMSSASGSWLDLHGKDWGVTRRDRESDEDYRKRIQAMLPIYSNGPTVGAISDIVKNFTGHPPILLEFGPMSFIMGATPIGNFVFNKESTFAFEVQVQNPGGKEYRKEDLEMVLQLVKPARSKVTIIHQGGI